MIWRCVDEVITTGIDFEWTYTNISTTPTVDWYKERLALHIEETWLKGTSKWKKPDWEKLHTEVFPDYEPDTRTYLAPAVYDTIQSIIWAMQVARYSPQQSIMEFIVEADTQVVLEDHVRKRKGKPDIVNHKKKIIADLKVVWNIDKLIEAIQFRWTFNLTFQYIRQLWNYDDLLWWWYKWQLIVVDHKCNIIIIDIPNELLVRAQELNERDIKELDYRLMQPSYATGFMAPELGTYGGATGLISSDMSDDFNDI